MADLADIGLRLIASINSTLQGVLFAPADFSWVGGSNISMGGFEIAWDFDPFASETVSGGAGFTVNPDDSTELIVPSDGFYYFSVMCSQSNHNVNTQNFAICRLTVGGITSAGANHPMGANGASNISYQRGMQMAAGDVIKIFSNDTLQSSDIYDRSFCIRKVR